MDDGRLYVPELVSPKSEEPVHARDRRLYPRHEVIWSGRLDTADGERIECAILDLSAGGAKVIAVQPLAVGEKVAFVSPRFESVMGRVVWSEGRKAGLEFLSDIDRVLMVLGGKEGEILPAHFLSLHRDASHKRGDIIRFRDYFKMSPGTGR